MPVKVEVFERIHERCIVFNSNNKNILTLIKTILLNFGACKPKVNTFKI